MFFISIRNHLLQMQLKTRSNLIKIRSIISVQVQALKKNQHLDWIGTIIDYNFRNGSWRCMSQQRIATYIYKKLFNLYITPILTTTAVTWNSSRYPEKLSHLIVRIAEILQEIRDVVAKHIINGLYHFRLQLLKLVKTVPTQNIPKVFYIREIPSR